MNRGRKFLLASVLALQNSNFIYPSCQKCFSRIILVSKRSHCPKCGSTGKAENVSYRYKLSLKIADSNNLFVITVFGSCLDPFFGLTANGLHRYIQDPDEISETLDRDAIHNLLTKAVEICFVGQSFIFGVTNFGNQHGQGSDSNNFLKQCSDRKREVKALVACQVVLPDLGVAGLTVIDYFHQLLQLSDSRKLDGSSQASNSHLLALEQTNSDPLSICGPESSSCFFKSHGRDNFSRFRQASLELTSTLSHLTNDFSALEQSKAIDTLHQNRKHISFAEATGSNRCHDAFQGSWSLISYMDKKSTAQKLSEEVDLQAYQPRAVTSSHEIRVTDSDFSPLKMQEPLESSNKKSFHSAVEINKYSPHELTCHQYHDLDNPFSLQKRSTCCPPSSLRLEEIVSGSQDCDPEIWDDLPFSESLNEFLAFVESEIAITQRDTSSRKCHLDNDIDRLHADHSKLSVTSQRTTGDLHTPPIALRLSQATIKASYNKVLSNCEENPSPTVQKESQSNDTAEAVSISSNGSDISEYLPPNAYLSALFPSSKGSETIGTLKSTRIPSHKAETILKHTTSESDHSCLNSKYFKRCGVKSLSEMNEKLVTLCSRKYNNVSDLCNLENKQHCRWPKNQGDSFTICRKLTYPLETLCSSPNRSTNTLKEMPCGGINNSTQNSSTGHEGSYNASADLFDDSAKEMDITTEIAKKSQNILLQWGKSLTESHRTESNFSLRSLPKNSNQSSQKLSSQSISASVCPRICSSPPRFQSDSEYDFGDSQDFVPCSQSTPVAGFHQTRIHEMKGTLKNLLAFYTDLDASYKKRQISSENDAQQATPSCPNNIKTPSQKFRSPVKSGIIQPEVFNNSLIAECSESDNEWIPPTTKKVFPSEILGFQAMGLRKCSAACDSPDEKELPRKKLKCVERIMNSGWLSKDSGLGVGSCSEVQCCFPFSENWPPSVPETKSSWSPELFS